MTCWTFEPRDPFVVRDGRPNQGRSESAVVRFPYPGTMAGLVRTRLGSDAHGCFVIPKQQLDDLRKVEVKGPLMARQETGELFVAAPRDCLLVEQSGATECRALHPLSSLSGYSLFDGALEMLPVGLDGGETITGKPPRNAPAWWPWTSFEQWLVDPGALRVEHVREQGIAALPTETRMHVKLGATETAEEGMLFAASGLRFRVARKTEETVDLALVVDVGDCVVGGTPRTLRPGLVPGGGERRLGWWSQAQGLTLPAIPDAVEQHLRKTGEAATVRVVLLTPGAFTAGWKPSWLLDPRHGVRVELKAACVPRPETISGWDFETRRPKASRRLVSAGSVYWLELHGEPDARVGWAREVWMQNVSDEDQDKRDGFGLAVVGVAP
jgi:CRISPR-associated protein Cmr3